MRIIAGTHRSRKLLAPRDPKGDAHVTRPITDRVKQSLFDRLWAAGLLDPERGGNALDIFAGIGSLGLEALSRGIEHCTFIEQHHGIRRLLEQNLRELDLADRAAVMKSDALSTGWIRLLPRTPITITFCDPPYELTRKPASLSRIAALIEALAPVTEDDGMLMLRTEREVTPPTVPGWAEAQSHPYGTMALHFFSREP